MCLYKVLYTTQKINSLFYKFSIKTHVYYITDLNVINIVYKDLIEAVIQFNNCSLFVKILKQNNKYLMALQ